MCQCANVLRDVYVMPSRRRSLAHWHISTLNNLRHVFPEGSSHQCLADASLLQQFFDFLQGKQVYSQAFRIFQMLLGNFSTSVARKQ